MINHQRLRVYIAAPWVHKADAAAAKVQIEAAGFEVVSSWITSHVDVDEAQPEAAAILREQALKDMKDLDRADIVVVLNLERSEGKSFEAGYAYGHLKSVVVVGGKENNIFWHLPAMDVVSTLEEAVKSLHAIEARVKQFVEHLQQQMFAHMPPISGKVN